METLQSNLNTTYPKVETSIRTYTHASSGAEVVVLGAMHVAHDPYYYPTLQQVMDDKSQAGAAIHYEKVKKATPAETQAVIDSGDASKILRRVRQIKTIVNLPYHLLEGTGFSTQKEGIALRDHWENHDASVIDLAQRFDPVALFAVSAVGKTSVPLMKFTSPQTRAKKILEVFRKSQDNPEVAADNPFQRLMSSVVIDYRNSIALAAYDALQEEQPGRDAVLFWGEGHQEGLGQGLQERGFTQTDEQRVMAIHGDTWIAQLESADA